MRIYITAFMLATTLGLVSCGGGNETASNSTSIVGQATFAETAIACNASSNYGGYEGAGPLLTATTNPTLAACVAAMPGIAYGSPWTPSQNGGCLESVSMQIAVVNEYYSGGNGPKISQSAALYCYNSASYCCTNYCPNLVGSQQAQNSFCVNINK